jgi:DNA-binding MarR family transcriptional regulator
MLESIGEILSEKHQADLRDVRAGNAYSVIKRMEKKGEIKRRPQQKEVEQR